MAILVRCGCGKQLQTSDENGGRRSRCPTCARELVIPRPKFVSDPEPDEDATSLVPFEADVATSGRAMASFLLGFCSLGCTLFTGLPAIVVGFLGLSEVRQSQGLLRGRPLAYLGIALGIFGSTVMSFVLLVPAFERLMAAGRERACASQLSQIGLAIHNFENRHGRFPPAALVDKQGQPLLSWRVAILPFLGPEGEALYQEFHLNEPWDSPHNVALLSKRPNVFACPGERKLGNSLTTYRVIVSPRTLFTGARKGVNLSEVTDGTSNTLMVVETSQPVPWTAPQEVVPGSSAPLMGIGSRHIGGFQTIFADGSVRFLDAAISPGLIGSLMTRDGGEVVSGFVF